MVEERLGDRELGIKAGMETWMNGGMYGRIGT